MDKAQLIIAIYTIIGLLLFALGILLVLETITGALVLRGNMLYIIVTLAIFMVFLGLHWLVVGIASLRSE